MPPEIRPIGPRARLALILAVALAGGGAAAAASLASAGALTLKTSANSTVGGTIVVSPAGRTLYTLTPETTRHLLCKGRECLSLWPPLIAPSRKTKLKDGPGVQGKLGLLRRSNGALQVTLRGKPLYRFNEDHRPGDAKGQDLETYGGVWHVVTGTAAAQSPPAMTPTTTTPTTPTSAPPYGY